MSSISCPIALYSIGAIFRVSSWIYEPFNLNHQSIDYGNLYSTPVISLQCNEFVGRNLFPRRDDSKDGMKRETRVGS